MSWSWRATTPRSSAWLTQAPGKPIVLKGLPRRTVKIRGFDTARCDYLRIEGFRIEDAGLGIKVASDHVQIVDNHFENLEEAAIGITDPTSAEKPAGAYVAFNEIYHCGKGMTTAGSNWLVERNEITRLFCYDKGDADYIRPFGTKMVFRQNYLHGSIKGEIKKSHTDAFQVFGNNNYVARDILIEENVCGEYHQGLMAEKAGHPENINHLTFRRNIFFQRGTQTGWADWGMAFDIPGLVADRNTFITGSSGSGGDHVRFDGNLFFGCLYWWKENEARAAVGRRNLIYDPKQKIPRNGLSHIPMPYGENVMNRDPLFVDAGRDNVRLRKGSPAIGASVDGATIGALDYPNVYYVDDRHAGASDQGFGYPAHAVQDDRQDARGRRGRRDGDHSRRRVS